MFVATLIAPILSSASIKQAIQIAPPLQQNWLSPNEACDLFYDTVPNLAAWALENKIDCIIQPAENRRKKALLADMESTIIEQEMLDELAAFAGVQEKVKDITRRSMNGELDFRAALAERLQLLKGVPSNAIDQLIAKITLIPGARELIATMRKNGATTVLVSGGFTCFTGHVAKLLGFHENHGNTLHIANTVLSGQMVEPVLDKSSKLATLNATAQKLGIAPADICAVGDGANDIPMLMAAGLGVAYHGKPAVQQRAKHNIRFSDLRALLFAQGYSKNEII